MDSRAINRTNVAEEAEGLVEVDVAAALYEVQ